MVASQSGLLFHRLGHSAEASFLASFVHGSWMVTRPLCVPIDQGLHGTPGTGSSKGISNPSSTSDRDHSSPAFGVIPWTLSQGPGGRCVSVQQNQQNCFSNQAACSPIEWRLEMPRILLLLFNSQQLRVAYHSVGSLAELVRMLVTNTGPRLLMPP